MKKWEYQLIKGENYRRPSHNGENCPVGEIEPEEIIHTCHVEMELMEVAFNWASRWKCKASGELRLSSLNVDAFRRGYKEPLFSCHVDATEEEPGHEFAVYIFAKGAMGHTVLDCGIVCSIVITIYRIIRFKHDPEDES